MENQDNPMIEKLRKLIAHEKSARAVGNLIEAEAFAGKIQSLLTAHKLSMSEIEFEDREQTEPIDWEEVRPTDINSRNKKTNVYWRADIARMVAKLNSCRIVNNSSTHKRTFFFVGRTSDREIAKMVYVYLVELGEELCLKAASQDRQIQVAKFCQRAGLSDNNIPSYYRLQFSAYMKTYRESWKVGFSDAIVERMRAVYEDMMQAQSITSAGAIIHIKKDALAVDEYLKGKTRKSTGRLMYDKSNADAYNRGKSTGSAVNLSPNRFNSGSGRSSRLLGA